MKEINKIASELCGKFVSHVSTDGGSPCIVTSLYYPNGDSIVLYFNRRGRQLEVTDYGGTLDALSHSGVEMNERKKMLDAICKREDVTRSGRSLSKILRPRSVSEDCLSFCQTITHISSWHFHQEQHLRSKLPLAIESLLEKKVRPKRQFVKQWHAQEHDPDGLFLVDYHFNGAAPARNLFFVTSESKALMVSAVVHFLRSHRLKTKTLAVIDRSAGVSKKQIERVQIAADELYFGLKGHEGQIVGFALGETK
jgi:hypothetical protein